MWNFLCEDSNTMNLPKLVILPTLKARKISDKQAILTQKLIDGIVEYQKYWSGSIVTLIEEDFALSNNLDDVTVEIDELPFRWKLLISTRFKPIQNFKAHL